MSVSYYPYIIAGFIMAMFLFGGLFLKGEHPPDYIVCNSTDMVIAFLDVGHGDCTVITDGDITIVVDTGSIFTTEKVLNYLYKMSVDDIDYLFVTHPHADHDGGVSAIYNYYTVHNYYTNKNISRGNRLVDGDIYMYVLNPSKSKTYSNVNDESIVLLLVKKDFELLLTGDIETKSENDIIHSSANVNADVLKVAHHGSDTSSQRDFLLHVSPDISVISCSDMYGNPNKAVVERLMKMSSVYITARDGDVIMTTDGCGTIQVQLPESDLKTTYMAVGDSYLPGG